MKRRVLYYVSAVSIGLLVTLGCSNDEQVTTTPAPSTHSDTAVDQDEQERTAATPPSVVVVILDTLRADASSSYGDVENTTPVMDNLAKDGILYERAYAPSPWTISSHTTLFSGLRIDEHGVGLSGVTVASDSIEMLAEDFQAAGYETIGFSENALVSALFGLDQGFDRFESNELIKLGRALNAGEQGPPPFDVVGSVAEWSQERDETVPFFLFINLFDPHDPYELRDVNPWLPEGTSRDEAAFVSSRYHIPSSICDGLPMLSHREILKGLYLGDVSEADRKLGAILKILDRAQGASTRLTIVTSDHGEHFGENRLMGHQFSVANAALHIPMIVTGVPGIEPASVGQPVELRSVRQSLRCWALGESCPAALPLANEPRSEGQESPDPIFSIYSDSVTRFPDWLMEQLGFADPDSVETVLRKQCTEKDPVFGDMVSMIRYPMKMTWFENSDPVLHDLSWDPAELSDQMQGQPKIAATLLKELKDFVQPNIIERETKDAPELNEEGYRQLKSLGYID